MYREAIRERVIGVCPAVEVDYRLDRPAFWDDTNRNEMRELTPFVWRTTLHHLATHLTDRATLIAPSDRIPNAVEEFLRLYGLVIQDGRINTHGMAWLGLAEANRDPREFDRPTSSYSVDIPNKHPGFVADARRCPGAHLASMELNLMFEEWLARLPDYELDMLTVMVERGGQLMLRTVPLRWSTAR